MKWKLLYIYNYAGSKFCLHGRVKKNGILKFKTTQFVPQWKFWAVPDDVPIPKMDIEQTFKELTTKQEKG